MGWRTIYILPILTLLFLMGVYFFVWENNDMGISIKNVEKPEIFVQSSQLIKIQPKIQLRDNEIATIEGFYWGDTIEWARSKGEHSICFDKQINVSRGSIVKVKANVINTTSPCSKVDILDYEILYDNNKIRHITNQFSYICPKIENHINKMRLNPIKLEYCLGDYGNTSWLYYEWIPFESKLVAAVEGNSLRGGYCWDQFNGAVVIDLVTNKISEIYLTKIEGICAIPQHIR